MTGKQKLCSHHQRIRLRRGSASESPMLWFAISVFVITCLLAIGFFLSGQPQSTSRGETTLRIYCASVAVAPLQLLVDRFNETSKQHATIARIGGSGELSGQIGTELKTDIPRGAHLFVSADQRKIEQLKQTFDDQLSCDCVTLAIQQPVIAVASTNRLNTTIFDLKTIIENPSIRFGVASENAAIGSVVREIAQSQGLLQLLEQRKTVDCENVMTLAQALKTGSIDCAILWDATVFQVNQFDGPKLSIVKKLEYQSETDCRVSAVLIGSQANEFLTYLKSNDSEVEQAFKGFGFAPASGNILSVPAGQP
jgi:ABC-type molybdate transport system substrate-binding protein